jgi:phosphoserine phosphatase RsbU/P
MSNFVNEDMSRALDQRLVELQSLFETSKVLNSSLNLRTILDNLLLTPMGRMMISRGMVIIHDTGEEYKVEIVKGLDRDLIGQKIVIEEPVTTPQRKEALKPENSFFKSFLDKTEIDLLLPIESTKRIVGFMCLGNKAGSIEFNENEIDFLSSLTNIAATSIENALMFKELDVLNRRLDKKIQELNTLFDISKELNSTLKPEKVLNLLIYAIMGEMLTQKCLVFLKENDAFQLGMYKGTLLSAVEKKLLNGSGLLKSLKSVKNVIRLDDEDISRNLKILSKLGLKIAVPMRLQNETRGVIAIGEKITKADFKEDDLEFLTTLGNQAMISLENARLFEETIEKQRMEDELEIARDIQRRLLPQRFPNSEQCEVYGLNMPSRQVGGDYFDVVSLKNDRVALIVADVSGKGVGASLLGASLQASIHSLQDFHTDIAVMIKRVNNLIHSQTNYDKFITLFYAELDLNTLKLTSVNAGHNPPYLVGKDGKMQKLEAGGLLLGMMPDVDYESETVQLHKNDMVIMFTDGVTEAKNKDDYDYEEWRLETLIQQNTSLDIKALIETIKASVYQFAAGEPQSDDVTLLGLKIE